MNRKLIESFTDQLTQFTKGEKAFCLFKTGVVEPTLPTTPLRGLSKIYDLQIPELKINLDIYLWEIAKLIGGRTFNLQYNIDPYDVSYWSPPLNFHFDRGARYTLLGAIRSSPNKYTWLLSIDKIISYSCHKNLASILMQSLFLEKGQNDCTFPLLVPFNNKLILNNEIITRNLEFNDIESRDSEGASAFEKFLQIIEYYNRLLLKPSDIDVDFTEQTERIALKDGDILLLNNAQILHGRSSGFVEDVSMNRWLRTMFIE